MLCIRPLDEPGIAANVDAQRLPVVDASQYVLLEQLTIIRSPGGDDQSAAGKDNVRNLSCHDGIPPASKGGRFKDALCCIRDANDL